MLEGRLEIFHIWQYNKILNSVMGKILTKWSFSYWKHEWILTCGTQDEYLAYLWDEQSQSKDEQSLVPRWKPVDD